MPTAAAQQTGNETAAGTGSEPGKSAQRPKLPKLEPHHMPRDYSVSVSAYNRGGTDGFLGRAPEGLVAQEMTGFEPTYVNIVDYIVRITHRIWEEKDIGYIYDTYSHDCSVWDDFGLQYGRDKIVADTVHTNNAFPDIRLIADEVVWAGDAQVGFHTSHRTKILGTNTGFSRFGPPTGKRVQLWCIANCVARANEIFHENVIYDTAGLLKQLGFDVVETARRFARAGAKGLPANFMAAEPSRLVGQGKPEPRPLPRDRSDVDAFVRAAFQTIWNRRNFGAIDDVYAANAVMQASTGRVYRGTGQIRSFALSLVAMFPDLAMSVDDLYWMGNAEDGFIASIRWGATGTHRGHGPYGEPTGKAVNIWGITQWAIRDGRIINDWTVFNEFSVLVQIVD